MAYRFGIQSITGTTPNSATTATVGSEVTGLGNYPDITVTADLVGATGGTLDVYVQRWDQEIASGAGNWVDWIHFPQLAAGAAAIRYAVNAAQVASSGITAVGVGLTPALAANTATGGHPGDKVRAIATAGASTSAGAAISISIRGRTG